MSAALQFMSALERRQLASSLGNLGRSKIGPTGFRVRMAQFRHLNLPYFFLIPAKII
jgi:hypothetical protein